MIDLREALERVMGFREMSRLDSDMSLCYDVFATVK